MLNVSGLSFRYQKNTDTVLDNVNLNINESGIYTILGRNGIGKTTLIKCILGLLKPTEGEVLIDGINIHSIKMKDRAKKISYVSQIISNTSLNVFDYIILGRIPYMNIRGSRSDYEVVYRIIDRLKLNDIALKPFNELSGGERQKVVIARCLAQESDIIIFDEPTSNLDINNIINLTSLLNDLLKEENKIILISTQDVSLGLSLDSKYIILKDKNVIMKDKNELDISMIKDIFNIENEELLEKYLRR